MASQPPIDPSPPIRVPFPWSKVMHYSGSEGTFYRWRPGIRWDEDGEDRIALADGTGAMLLREVGRYTPPGFGARVFYTRQWETPDGEVVGKPRLRVMGVGGFTVLCRGYRYDVELTDELADVKMGEPPIQDEDFADAASY